MILGCPYSGPERFMVQDHSKIIEQNYHLYGTICNQSMINLLGKPVYISVFARTIRIRDKKSPFKLFCLLWSVPCSI